MNTFIMLAYVVLWNACGMWAMIHRDDTDERGYFKFQWRFLIWFFMVCALPFVAKWCGLL